MRRRSVVSIITSLLIVVAVAAGATVALGQAELLPFSFADQPACRQPRDGYQPLDLGGHPAAGQILWKARHETGDLSEWRERQGEAVFNTGTGRVEVTDTVARQGSYGLKLSITDASDAVQAARIFRWANQRQEAYYSAWICIPRTHTPAAWWNVFQFKSQASDGDSDSAWQVNVFTDERGQMSLYWWDTITQSGYTDRLAPLTVRPGRWTHIEVFFQASAQPNGRVALWQDGVLLYDLAGVQTLVNEDDAVHWGLANYTDAITPGDPTIYVDDAAISTVRLGPWPRIE